MRRLKRKMTLLLAACLLLLALVIPASTLTLQAEGNVYEEIDDLSHATFGLWAGSASEYVLHERLPEAEVRYYATFPDMAQDLQAGRIDAVAVPGWLFMQAAEDYTDLTMIQEPLGQQETSVIFAEDGTLRKQFNEYLAGLQESGELTRIIDKWMNTNDMDKVEYEPVFSQGENGTVHAVTPGNEPPMTLKEGNQYLGIEAEVVNHFCAAYGYKLEMTSAVYESMLTGVKTGKYDLGYGNVEFTPERLQNMYFGDSMVTMDVNAIVRSGSSSRQGLLQTIESGIYKTFVKNNRWQQIVGGMGTTLWITFCAIVCGTFLGLALYTWCYQGGRIRNAVMNGLSSVVLGLPVVVMLMIVYYVVFGRSKLSGTTVSIIAFSGFFTITVFGLLKNSVASVGVEQKEGALALGYTERETFTHIILPQAMRSFLPLYRVEIVNLMKATAIVGYVAVSDLTREGDLIRAATFDAFFPLITVALIYLALAWIIILLMNRVIYLFDPKHRTEAEILKGIVR